LLIQRFSKARRGRNPHLFISELIIDPAFLRGVASFKPKKAAWYNRVEPLSAWCGWLNLIHYKGFKRWKPNLFLLRLRLLDKESPMRISKAYAQKVADRAFAKNMNFNYDWDSVRDYCDDVTYGDIAMTLLTGIWIVSASIC
tara:strand:- start:2193 stop:2618 length:426 start_codon:yes stop_codon:yes gene_type:complete